MRVMARTGAGVRGLKESGSIVILTAILFPFVLAIGAIGVNVSMLWVERRALFTATDAAALAGAVAYSTARPVSGAPVAMKAACDTYMEVNGFDVDGNGFTQGTTTRARALTSYECVFVPATTTSSSYVRVRAFSTPRLFLVPGVVPTRIGAASAAASGPPSGLYGARPFSICREAVDTSVSINLQTGEEEPSDTYGSAALATWLDPSSRHYLSETKRWRIIVNDPCPIPGAPTFRQIERTPWGYDSNVSANEVNRLVRSGVEKTVFVCDPMGSTAQFASQYRDAFLAASELSPDPDPNVRNPVTLPAAIISWLPNGTSACQGRPDAVRVAGYIGIQIHGIDQPSGRGAGAKQWWDVSFHQISVSGICCDDAGPSQPVTTTVLCDPVLGCTRRTP